MSVEIESRHPIEELADEFAERYRRGEEPSIDDYAARFPELADEIRDLFPALVWMEDSAVCRSAGSKRSGSWGSETPAGRSARGAGDETVDVDVPQSIGRFQITRLIGIGGFGIVFEALDPDLHRKVALKIPRAESLLTGESRHRFLREAEAAAILDHPGIVPVYESGHAGGVCYIVSAYVEGPTLAAWLAERAGSVPPREAAELVRVLAEAVQHAHSRGVLHRDLKPANVLMSDVPRITDFGLARFVGDDSGQTRANAIIGTPAYMAPEQAEGRSRDVGTAADIYALGAILYELLTRRPPFERESTLATLLAVRGEDPPPPARLAARVPADLEAVCLKCLEKQPERRYASAAALADDLQRFLRGEPVTARRPTRSELVRRWCARNRVAAALLSMVTLLTVLIAVGSTIAAVLLGESRQDVLDHLAREIEAKDAATRNEDLAIRALYEARVAQAHAQSSSGLIGQRMQSLAAITAAVQSADRLRLGDGERLRLRNEAIAALVLPDLIPEESWDFQWRQALWFDTDGDVEHYACNSDDQTILVRRLRDNVVVQRLAVDPTVAGPRSFFRGIRFSPDGRWLAAHYWSGSGYVVQVWALALDATPDAGAAGPDGLGLRPAFIADGLLREPNPAEFSADGDRLAVAKASGDVEVRATGSFEVLTTLRGSAPARRMCFNLAGTQLAVYRVGRIEIVDLSSGTIIRSIAQACSVYDLDWSPDGRRLAAACDDNSANVWNAATGRLDTTLSGHSARVRRVAFHPQGRLIATRSDDGTTRFWGLHYGHQLLLAEIDFTNFSRDGRRLGAPAARFRFQAGDAVSAVSFHQAVDRHMSAIDLLSVDATGRVLLVSGADECALVDLSSAAVITAERVDYGWIRFNALGTEAYGASDRAGLCRLPVQSDTSGERMVLSIGPPERLASATAGLVAASDDGRRVASVDWRSGRKLVLFDADRGAALTLRHPFARFLDVSRDGRLVAAGTWASTDVMVWDATDGRVLKTLPTNSARVQFSPDGSRLVVDEGRRYTVWNVDDWQRVATVEAKSDSSYPSPVAFSCDRRWMAVLESHRKVRLLDATTLAERARFTLPEHCFIQALCFTPDGTRLIAGTFRPGMVYIWDLPHIRAELAAMRLDWEGAPDPHLPNESTGKLEVQLNLGELAGRASGR